MIFLSHLMGIEITGTSQCAWLKGGSAHPVAGNRIQGLGHARQVLFLSCRIPRPLKSFKFFFLSFSLVFEFFLYNHLCAHYY